MTVPGPMGPVEDGAAIGLGGGARVWYEIVWTSAPGSPGCWEAPCVEFASGVPGSDPAWRARFTLGAGGEGRDGVFLHGAARAGAGEGPPPVREAVELVSAARRDMLESHLRKLHAAYRELSWEDLGLPWAEADVRSVMEA